MYASDGKILRIDTHFPVEGRSGNQRFRMVTHKQRLAGVNDKGINDIIIVKHQSPFLYRGRELDIERIYERTVEVNLKVH